MGIVDQKAIYDRVLGLLVSQRDLNLQDVFATEQSMYRTSVFDSDGAMRILTVNNSIYSNLQVETAQKKTGAPITIICDVLDVIWTLQLPANGIMDTLIYPFKHWVLIQIHEADTCLCFDMASTRTSKSRAVREAKGEQCHGLTALPCKPHFCITMLFWRLTQVSSNWTTYPHFSGYWRKVYPNADT